MSFAGKATYSTGKGLPAAAECMADVVGIISPYETQLLDVLGDPLRAATSTHHEWLEDVLLPNKDKIKDEAVGELEVHGADRNCFCVANIDRFREGDQIQPDGSCEIMLVSEIELDFITVVRGYAGTERAALVDGQVLNILGNASIEGGEKPTARFTKRSRHSNYTQIFTRAVEVSATDMAANQLGLSDEMDYQKQERLRELLRELENNVINGAKAVQAAQGASVVGRAMTGIIPQLKTNAFKAGAADFPDNPDLCLDESKINFVLKSVWENSSGNVDLIVVGGYQKRQIEGFLSKSGPENTYTDRRIYYESDFGQCTVIVSRWMPQDAALFLDSSRVNVLPLAGRSFHFNQLPTESLDSDAGELIGEYTLELKNEAAHGLIRGLSTE